MTVCGRDDDGAALRMCANVRQSHNRAYMVDEMAKTEIHIPKHTHTHAIKRRHLIVINICVRVHLRK